MLRLPSKRPHCCRLSCLLRPFRLWHFLRFPCSGWLWPFRGPGQLFYSKLLGFIQIRWIWGKKTTEVEGFLVTSYQGVHVSHAEPPVMLTLLPCFRWGVLGFSAVLCIMSSKFSLYSMGWGGGSSTRREIKLHFTWRGEQTLFGILLYGMSSAFVYLFNHLFILV